MSKGPKGLNDWCYSGKKIALDILEFEMKMKMRQEPLGEDFEKVLYDNLEDLYVKDSDERDS